MVDKRWLVLGSIVVIVFMCVGMMFIPLALRMGRQVVSCPQVDSGEGTSAPCYPMMPMRGGHFGGRGIFLLLPMLACFTFPLVLLFFWGMFLARRHGWAAMHANGSTPPWRHHPCDPASHAAADAKPATDDKPATGEV
jgi:hypothetical protein